MKIKDLPWEKRRKVRKKQAEVYRAELRMYRCIIAAEMCLLVPLAICIYDCYFK